MASRTTPAWRRTAQGLLLACGAPAGWLLILWIEGTGPVDAVRADPGLYAYLLLASAVVFAGFGLLLGRQEQRLAEINAMLEDLSVTDSLTGIPNRRYFDLRLAEEAAGAQRSGVGLAVGILDIDNFKVINDTYGHPTGDTVLESIAEAMMAVLRSGETLARVGGEEFGVLLRGDDPADGVAACERLRRAAAAVRVIAGDRTVRVTLTGGVATSSDVGAVDPDEIYAAADRRLYAGKNAGRDRVVGPERAATAPDS